MTDEEIIRCLGLLGIPPQEFAVLGEGSYEQRLNAIDALKKQAKRLFKRKAHLLHPDKTGGDETKAEDLYLLNRFMEEVDRMVPPMLTTATSKTGTSRRHRGTLRLKLSIRTSSRVARGI